MVSQRGRQVDFRPFIKKEEANEYPEKSRETNVSENGGGGGSIRRKKGASERTVHKHGNPARRGNLRPQRAWRRMYRGIGRNLRVTATQDIIGEI